MPISSRTARTLSLATTLAAAAALATGCSSTQSAQADATADVASAPVTAEVTEFHAGDFAGSSPLVLGAGDRLGWALFERHVAADPMAPAGTAYAIVEPD
jgi:hypothetical protein